MHLFPSTNTPPIPMDYEYLQPNEEEWERQKVQAKAAGAQALSRLIRFAERSDTGQSRTVAGFIAALIEARPYDMYDLHDVDVAISDDMLICLDAIRWIRYTLVELVPGGRRRCISLCECRGLVGTL